MTTTPAATSKSGIRNLKPGEILFNEWIGNNYAPFAVAVKDALERLVAVITVVSHNTCTLH